MIDLARLARVVRRDIRLARTDGRLPEEVRDLRISVRVCPGMLVSVVEIGITADEWGLLFEGPSAGDEFTPLALDLGEKLAQGFRECASREGMADEAWCVIGSIGIVIAQVVTDRAAG